MLYCFLCHLYSLFLTIDQISPQSQQLTSPLEKSTCVITLFIILFTPLRLSSHCGVAIWSKSANNQWDVRSSIGYVSLNQSKETVWKLSSLSLICDCDSTGPCVVIFPRLNLSFHLWVVAGDWGVDTGVCARVE